MDKHLTAAVEAAFKAAIERAMLNDMVWGGDDCSLWAVGVPLEVTGIDLAAPFRGYSTAFGAARRLKAYAGGGLVEAAIKVAATARLKPANRPFRGNLIGLVMAGARPSLALFWRGGWLARSQNGVLGLPAASGIMAWRWL
jgi:hypothetical protein